jgi:hypothetical protein
MIKRLDPFGFFKKVEATLKINLIFVSLTTAGEKGL